MKKRKKIKEKHECVTKDGVKGNQSTTESINHIINEKSTIIFNRKLMQKGQIKQHRLATTSTKIKLLQLKQPNQKELLEKGKAKKTVAVEY